MRDLGVRLTISALLGSGYRATIDRAMKGIDDIGGKAGGLKNNLADIGKTANNLGDRLMDVGKAWAAIGFVKQNVAVAADLEKTLTEIGITADMSGGQVEQLRQQLRQLSSADQTNQSVENLARAFKAMVSAGMDNEKAAAAMKAVGRTATATGADIEDLAKTAFTLVDTMGIAPDALDKELNRLAFTGKKGAFELKDMSRYFPTLGAAAKEAGLQGSEGVATLGAALQMARKATGESSEAANNFRNFMSKMLAPETLKNFKEANVDLMKVFTQGSENGGNPIEAVLKQIDTMLGDDPAKRKQRLGALFGDEQVKDFIRPMLANMANYKQMKQEALNAAGVVDQDYARVLATFKAKSDAATNAVTNLGESFGRSWLPPLGLALGLITPVIGAVSGIAERFPGATFAVTALGAGMMILPPALFAVRLGITAIGRSMLATPIGLFAVGIATAAGFIYDNWAPIKEFFTGIWSQVQPAWTEFSSFVIEWADIVIAPLRTLQGLWKDLGGAVTGKGLDFSNTKAAIGQNFEAAAKMGDRFGAGDSVRQLGAKAIGAAGADGADGKVRVELDFRNMPRGVDVQSTVTGRGIDPEFDTSTGYIMAGT